jgi:hypothetical protein
MAALLALFAPPDAGAAIRFDAFGEGVEYGSEYFDWDSGGVTIMAWVYVANDRHVDTAFVSIRGAGILYIDPIRQLSIYTGNSQFWTTNTVIQLGEWHHYALVRDTNRVWRAYMDGVADVVGQNLVEPTGDAHPYFGNDNYGDWLDGRITAGKIWLASLSQAEIQAEMGSYAAIRTTNLWSVVPMQVHTNLTDQSGLGHTPTAMGTLSTEEGPLALEPSNPPVLQIQIVGTNVVISWPSSAAGYGLQSSPAVATTNSWTSVTNVPAIAGPHFFVTNSLFSGSFYYRLKKSQ